MSRLVVARDMVLRQIEKRSKKNRVNGERGFTLLELVIAVGVIAVLTVGGMVSYNAIQTNSKRAAAATVASEAYIAGMNAAAMGSNIHEAVWAINEKSYAEKNIRVHVASADPLRVTAFWYDGAKILRVSMPNNEAEAGEGTRVHAWLASVSISHSEGFLYPLSDENCSVLKLFEDGQEIPLPIDPLDGSQNKLSGVFTTDGFYEYSIEAECGGHTVTKDMPNTMVLSPEDQIIVLDESLAASMGYELDQMLELYEFTLGVNLQPGDALYMLYMQYEVD